MIQRLLPGLGLSIEEKTATALPFLLVLCAVLAVTYVVVAFSVGPMQDPLRLALFTALMAMHAFLHLFSPRLRELAQKNEGRKWLTAYLAVQGLLLLGMGAMSGSPGIMVGLYVALVGEAVIIVWPNPRATMLVVLACLGLFALNGALGWDSEVLMGWLPAIALLAAFAFAFLWLYVDFIRNRESAQHLQQELLLAQQRQQTYAALVQDLGLVQQKQSAALSQQEEFAGTLAELLRQLEAAGRDLEDSLSGTVQEDLQRALEQAQATFQVAADARHALRASPPQSGSLIESLIQQVEQFTTSTGIQASLEVDDLEADIPPGLATGIQHILDEGLANVARHAQASQVAVQIQTSEGELKVVIQDDGVGFNVAESIVRPEFHGLASMQERARRMGGHLRLESIPGSGTRLVLTLQT